MFNFWWSAKRSEQKMLTKTQKNKKGPLSHQKIKCSFLDYVQLLMIGRAIWAKTLSEMQKNEKGPLSHQKIKCSFLDYIQLLMIGWAISTENIDRNAKKWRRPPKSLKNKMFIFGLCSTSDAWPSDLNKKRWPKRKKNEKGPLSHQKIKCSFLDYIQLLMIGWAIRAKNVDRNTKKWKKPPKS